MTKVYDLSGGVKGEIELPRVFSVAIRPDLIQRAVLALQAARRQPYGTDPHAGKRTSARYLGVKGKRGSMKNREIARGPRVVESPSLRMRFVPQAKGGRAPHPPKTAKAWQLKINARENRLALASAIAATAVKQLVQARGHRIPDIELPIIVSADIETVKKARELRQLIACLKLEREFGRASEKIRAGRGKMRGRRYKHKKGPLFIVAEDKGIGKSAGNLPGTDVAVFSGLNTELLAPGAQPGRLAIWSEAAIKKLGEAGKAIPRQALGNGEISSKGE